MKKRISKSAAIVAALGIAAASGAPSAVSAEANGFLNLGSARLLRTNVLALNGLAGSSSLAADLNSSLKGSEGKCGEGKCGEGKCGEKEEKEESEESEE